jgi:single-strand DNA-binding protein
MYQQTTLVGNVGQSPDTRQTPSGKTVTKFSVAINEKYGDKETTTWYNVSCWDKLGEVVSQYVTKGMLVLVVGRVSVRAYTNRAGEPAASLDMTAQTVKFLSGKGTEATSEPDAEPMPSVAEDIPW